ncbi:MAG: hypothetical protein JNJ83_18880 [Verrucomicrobiaceae bacterium]|nr:hypothetical protein [Verrucomicrobiaceae bacterium]
MRTKEAGQSILLSPCFGRTERDMDYMDCGSLLPLSGGQPAGRRMFQDDVLPRRSRVCDSRGAFDGQETLAAAGLPRKSGSRLPQSMFHVSGGQPAGRRMFQDEVSPRRFRVGVSRGAFRWPGDFGGSRLPRKSGSGLPQSMLLFLPFDT